MALATQTAVDIPSTIWPGHKVTPHPCFGGSQALFVQQHPRSASTQDSPSASASHLSGYTHPMQSAPSSSVGPFRVFGYSPSEGPPGTTITVRVELLTKRNDPLFLRLVIDHRALSTSVHRLPYMHGGGWQVLSTIPSDMNVTTAYTVPLTVQALDSRNEVVNSFTFGKFTFRPQLADGNPPGFCAAEPNPNASTSATRKPTTLKTPASRSRSSRVGQSSSARRQSTDDRSPRRQQLVRQKKGVAPGRRLCLGGDDSGSSQRAQLELLVSLESMAKDWDEDEMKCGRRLVRFTRVQDGATIQVSCEPIKQQEYCEDDVVVSCIYRKGVDKCYVTSVDIIYLLEHLVQEDFDIEEKNRIRRNLEGFRPKTISRNRVESNDFFMQIMNFPPPKPRNIEKDVKVFDWNILPQALDKIVSRYALAVPLSEDDVGVATDFPSPPLQSTSRLSPSSDFTDHQRSGSHLDSSPELVHTPDMNWEPYDSPYVSGSYDRRPGPSGLTGLPAAPPPSFFAATFSPPYSMQVPFDASGDMVYGADTLDTQAGLYSALTLPPDVRGSPYAPQARRSLHSIPLDQLAFSASSGDSQAVHHIDSLL